MLAPDLAQATFRHLDLVRLPHPRVLVVMVSQTGIVTNKVVEVEERLAQEQLQACANYLNAHFAGMSLGRDPRPPARAHEAGAGPLRLAPQERDRPRRAGLRRARPSGQGHLPRRHLEHARPQGVRGPRPHEGPLQDLRGEEPAGADPERLHGRATGCASSSAARTPSRTCATLASSPRAIPSRARAASGLGVLGSTRMEYASAVTLVDHVARAVSQVLREMRRERRGREAPDGRQRQAVRLREGRAEPPRGEPAAARPEADALGGGRRPCGTSWPSSRSSSCAGGPTSRTTGSAWSATGRTRATRRPSASSRS